MNKKYLFNTFFCIFTVTFTCSSVLAHDTTHIHPLITDKIADLIRDTDNNKAYKDIHELDPDKQEVQGMEQRLYWGTDFDAGKSAAELTQDWLLGDEGLSAFHAPLNAMNGVVQEDVPSLKPGRVGTVYVPTR